MPKASDVLLRRNIFSITNYGVGVPWPQTTWFQNRKKVDSSRKCLCTRACMVLMILYSVEHSWMMVNRATATSITAPAAVAASATPNHIERGAKAALLLLPFASWSASQNKTKQVTFNLPLSLEGTEQSGTDSVRARVENDRGWRGMGHGRTRLARPNSQAWTAIGMGEKRRKIPGSANHEKDCQPHPLGA